ncbi:MAG: glycosyltransferase [Acidimicrobiia bacterium]|nr:glycosyltransferase [Acidimicrobiia bacterium]
MSHVLVVGGFDPVFPRNRQILDLLDRAGHVVDARPVPMWGASLPEAASSRGAGLAANAALGLIRVAVETLRASRPDVVLLLHPSQFDALVVRPIAALRRLPVLVDLFISLQDTVVEDRRLVARGSLLGWLTGALDRFAARGATRILTDTPQHADALAKMTGTPRDRFRRPAGRSRRPALPSCPLPRRPDGSGPLLRHLHPAARHRDDRARRCAAP